MSVLSISAFLGLIIGNGIALLLVNTFSMFNEMSYGIDIPWSFLILILLFSFIASWITARGVLKRIIERPISEIFRLD